MGKQDYVKRVRKKWSHDLTVTWYKLKNLNNYKVMFNFQYHKGIIKSESTFFGMKFVKHVLYFEESAAALNKFKYFLPKSCL